MTKTHYIAMGGLHGYLPSHCNSYESLQDAIESLCNLYELGRMRKKELSDNLYLELSLHGRDFPYLPPDRNEYCEIVECNCNHPEVHNDD